MARKATSTKAPATESLEKAADGLTAREHIEQALQGLRYGSVTVFVQDGSVVLVERTEKRRVV